MLLGAWRRFLEKSSYRVLSAENGEEAIDIYLGHHDRIALIVLDLGLPKIGGREVYLKMKEVNPQAKVMIISGYMDPDLLAEMRKLGARDFLQKPVTAPNSSGKDPGGPVSTCRPCLTSGATEVAGTKEAAAFPSLRCLLLFLLLNCQ